MVLSLLYINKGLAFDPEGLFATLTVFKLKLGSNKKYCSKTISALKLKLWYKGIISNLKLDNFSFLNRGTNLPLMAL